MALRQKDLPTTKPMQTYTPTKILLVLLCLFIITSFHTSSKFASLFQFFSIDNHVITKSSLSSPLRKHHNVPPHQTRLKNIGSKEGGWTCDVSTFTSNTIVYDVGLGEDTSWDEGLIHDYNLQVYGYDPTPTSTVQIDASFPTRSKFHHVQEGLGIQAGTKTLTLRKHNNMRARAGGVKKGQDAATNINININIKVNTLENWMKSNGHTHIDALKIDIAGSEYEVLEDWIDRDYFPMDQLLVAWHFQLDSLPQSRHDNVLRGLKSRGWLQVHSTDNGKNTVFVRARSTATTKPSTTLLSSIVSTSSTPIHHIHQAWHEDEMIPKNSTFPTQQAQEEAWYDYAQNISTTPLQPLQLPIPPAPVPTKILVTVATALGRRWITILTLLSITNALTQMVEDGYQVDLLVSFVGSPYDVAIKKILTTTSFTFHLITEHVNVTQGQGGFVRSREHLVDYFLDSTPGPGALQYSHWMHLDDDMIVGHDKSLSRSMDEYMTYLEPNKADTKAHANAHANANANDGGGIGGLLVLFLNSWSQPSVPTVNYGPLYTIRYAGAPAFVLSRQTLIRIGGNPYTSCRLERKKGCPDGEAANAWFWNKLKTNQMSLISNTQYPYAVQHLANSQSLIFGKQTTWEHLWATNRNEKYMKPTRKNKNKKISTTIVQVPPYVLKEVRHAVRPMVGTKIQTKVHSKLGHNIELVNYVLRMNRKKKIGKVSFPLKKIDELKEDFVLD